MALKQVFFGDERAQMHEELRRYLDNVTDWYDADAYAADLARKDPSLLTDHLDSRYGPQVVVRSPDFDTPSKPLNTAGTWCMFAAARELPKTLEVALSAGVGPDDPDVFLQGGLLSYRVWSLRHHLLAIALKYKANPDVQIQPQPGSQVWPGAPGQVSFRNAVLNWRSDDATKHLVSVKMLLEAGAKCVGSYNSSPSVDYPSAVWELANRSFVFMDSMRAAVELIPLMKAAGFDINSSCGPTFCPPVVAAARAKSRPMVEALIAAGCRTDDLYIARDATEKLSAVEPLFTEIDKAFGAGAHSWAIEAMMKAQWAASNSAGTRSTEPTTTSVPRVRARAV